MDDLSDKELDGLQTRASRELNSAFELQVNRLINEVRRRRKEQDELVNNAINDGRYDVARAISSFVYNERSDRTEELEREIRDDPYTGIAMALEVWKARCTPCPMRTDTGKQCCGCVETQERESVGDAAKRMYPEMYALLLVTQGIIRDPQLDKVSQEGLAARTNRFLSRVREIKPDTEKLPFLAIEFIELVDLLIKKGVL
jgi:hypothetical protein